MIKIVASLDKKELEKLVSVEDEINQNRREKVVLVAYESEE